MIHEVVYLNFSSIGSTLHSFPFLYVPYIKIVFAKIFVFYNLSGSSFKAILETNSNVYATVLYLFIFKCCMFVI